MSVLEITRGDTEYLDMVAKVGDATVDLTDALDIWFYVKRAASDSDAMALIKKHVGAGVTIAPDQVTNKGKATIKIDSEDTRGIAGTFLYELQIRDGSGDTQTMASGTINIKADLVRA